MHTVTSSNNCACEPERVSGAKLQKCFWGERMKRISHQPVKRLQLVSIHVIADVHRHV